MILGNGDSIDLVQFPYHFLTLCVTLYTWVSVLVACRYSCHTGRVKVGRGKEGQGGLWGRVGHGSQLELYGGMVNYVYEMVQCLKFIKDFHCTDRSNSKQFSNSINFRPRHAAPVSHRCS